MAIYIATHKRATLPTCDWMVPIGLSGYKDDNVIISDTDGKEYNDRPNRNYCELTGMRWLSDNAKDNYIGLCHYRRFFSFLPYTANAVSYPSYLEIEESKELNSFLASESQKSKLENLLEIYEVILPKPVFHAETIAQAFINAHGKEIWEVFLEKCRNIFGNKTDFYRHETRFHFGNMLIAPRKIFTEYTKELFGVIDSVYDEIGDIADLAGARYQPCRYPGYLAERFMSFYAYERGLRIHETPTIWTK